MLEDIFNFDNAICLYCNSACDINSWGTEDLFTESYTCQKCDEKFELLYEQETLVSIVFTCNKIEIVYLVEINSFGIKHESDEDTEVLNRNWIPVFKIDFSQKDLMFKKFSTYLLFSF